jgi:hypothetical protein
VDFEIKKLLSDLSWVEYRLALLGVVRRMKSSEDF